MQVLLQGGDALGLLKTHLELSKLALVFLFPRPLGLKAALECRGAAPILYGLVDALKLLAFPVWLYELTVLYQNSSCKLDVQCIINPPPDIFFRLVSGLIFFLVASVLAEDLDAIRILNIIGSSLLLRKLEMTSVLLQDLNELCRHLFIRGLFVFDDLLHYTH